MFILGGRLSQFILGDFVNALALVPIGEVALGRVASAACAVGWLITNVIIKPVLKNRSLKY